MIKFLLALTTVWAILAGVVVSLEGDLPLLYPDASSKFSYNDLAFLDIALRDSKEELIDIMGEPDRIAAIFADAIGGYVYHFYYDDFGVVFLYPSFRDDDGYWVYTVFLFTITNEKHIGPRGIRIGDCYKEVIRKFYTETPLLVGFDAIERHYLYGGPGDPETGVLLFDDDGALWSIVYEHTLLREDGSFSGIGYFLLFNIEYDIVTSIRIGLLWVV